MAQKDESLIQEMREQLRGDRERAERRTLRFPKPLGPVSADEATADDDAVSPRRSLGARLRAFVRPS